MVANILIAIGFFFAGILAGTILTGNAAKKALEEERHKHTIVYEF